MKKIIISIIGIAIILHFVSCDESVLETAPTDRYVEATWWQTEDQTMSTLYGIYNAVRGANGFKAASYYIITPNSYGSSQIATGTHNAFNSDESETTWNVNYRGIGRANYFLANVERTPFNDQSILEQVKGEAVFCRALFYFNLINYFGGVPLILDPPNFRDHSDLPRDTRESVINHILTDLNNAVSVLPVSAESGRATKGAALALKARFLLYESRWAEAAQTAKDVMNLDVYSLFPDYRRLFLDKSNEEVIFEVQYKEPDVRHSMDTYLRLQLNINPTLDLVNSYLMKDGLSIDESPLYDPEKPYDYENRDSRFQKTIIIVGSMFNGGIVPFSDYHQTGFGFKKYTGYEDDVEIEIAKGYSSTNWIVLRYADVLLMYAEAQNEASGPDETVYNAINEIRSRADMPDIPTGLSKEEMREVIRHERRIELVLEDLYYHDIRRWRIAEDVMNAEVKNSEGEVISERSFNPQRDYLWPIHTVTLTENPALIQNPEY